MNFGKEIVSWYEANKRNLPWRKTKDPYPIWLSEVILQQTRVAQGLPYFRAFLKAFPSVTDLSKAPQSKVLKLWQGLGYYSRARNLHEAAKQVVEMGEFPKDYQGLLKLKGVGDYTAAAIASFAYNEPVAVVDGNVYRVLSRYFDMPIAINSTEGIKEFKKLAQQLILKDSPATYNQAIMEFGALQCVPKNPNCSSCPLQTSCAAYKNDTISIRPVKIKKTKVLKVHHHYLVIEADDQKTIVKQRDESGIWAGLYEFPFINADGPMLPSEIQESEVFKKLIENKSYSLSAYNQEPIIHLLSHRKIHAYFWILKLDDPLENAVSIEEAFSKPLPKLMENFMSEYWKRELTHLS